MNKAIMSLLFLLLSVNAYSAISFDGVDSTIQLCSAVSMVNENNTMTIGATFKFPATPDTGRILTIITDTGSTWFSIEAKSSGTFRGQYRDNATDTGKILTTSGTFNDGNFHSIAFQAGSSGINLVVDGTLTNTTTDTLRTNDLSTQTPYIGSFNNSSAFLEGTISDVWISDQTVSLSKLYTYTEAPFKRGVLQAPIFINRTYYYPLSGTSETGSIDTDNFPCTGCQTNLTICDGTGIDPTGGSAYVEDGLMFP